MSEQQGRPTTCILSRRQDDTKNPKYESEVFGRQTRYFKCAILLAASTCPYENTVTSVVQRTRVSLLVFSTETQTGSYAKRYHCLSLNKSICSCILNIY